VEPAAKPPFAAGELVLVTGGARGVTAAAALELARACKPTLALWGRSPRPAAEPADVAACLTERDLKALFAKKGLKPKEIGERCRRALADREIRATLAAVEAAGATVVYDAVDVRDEKAVRAALARLKAEHGPLRGIVHGAGVLADRKIEDKTAEQFDDVWATKVTGLRHILAQTDLSALKGLVLFSSSTARYGRLGQSDYAMANEALNKIARLLSRRLPQARVCAIGWGPWDGGMVTDSLKPLFAAEGIGLIGLEAGGKLLVSEMSEASRAVELVVLGTVRAASAASETMSVALERQVSVKEFPILSSHVINGRAVLPTALIVELLAHGALHGQPGLSFTGVDELRILKGVLLNADETRALLTMTGKPVKRDGLLAVPAELRGTDGTRHASATVLLSAKTQTAPSPAGATAPARRAPAVEDVYSRILFHGPDMRFIRSVTALSDAGIDADAAGALPPKQWLARPWRDRWVADPAALDAAFQAMIVWTTEVLGAPSLPSFAARYRQYAAFPSQGCAVRCRASRKGDALAAADVDFVDAEGRLIARLEGYECTVEPSLAEAFRRREARAA
jgi:NAD(P)-dependent dehydrogenase (short-subunit alcohol dehydrogenase family)